MTSLPTLFRSISTQDSRTRPMFYSHRRIRKLHSFWHNLLLKNQSASVDTQTAVVQERRCRCPWRPWSSLCVLRVAEPGVQRGVQPTGKIKSRGVVLDDVIRTPSIGVFSSLSGPFAGAVKGARALPQLSISPQTFPTVFKLWTRRPDDQTTRPTSTVLYYKCRCYFCVLGYYYIL